MAQATEGRFDMDESSDPARKSFSEEMEPYLARGDMQTVLGLAQGRLQKMPDDLDARVVICRVWLQQGRIDEARNMVQEIEEILSGLSHLYACMGDLYIKKGLDNEAELFYRKFAALNPAASPPMDGKGRVESLTELARTEDAEPGEEDETGSDISPGFETATLAELYLRQGHLQMAEEMLEKIIGRDPLNDRAQRLLDDIQDLRSQEANALIKKRVLTEISRWLDNIGNLQHHAL
jgi:tetratricopeptide (TPR) repeat protein